MKYPELEELEAVLEFEEEEKEFFPDYYDQIENDFTKVEFVFKHITKLI